MVQDFALDSDNTVPMLGHGETMNEPSRPFFISGLGEKKNNSVSPVVDTDIKIVSESMLATATANMAATHRTSKRLQGNHVVILISLSVLIFFGYERLVVDSEDRLIPSGAIDRLLEWVKAHPRAGMFVILMCMTIAPLTLAQVSSALGMGIGYVYTVVYGWPIGYPLATAVMHCGTVTGACACFLAGRYLMQDHVRSWIRGNRMLEAVNIGEEARFFRDDSGEICSLDFLQRRGNNSIWSVVMYEYELTHDVIIFQSFS
jgi:hypothetical protein